MNPCVEVGVEVEVEVRYSLLMMLADAERRPASVCGRAAYFGTV